MPAHIETDTDMSIALARAKRNFSYRLFEALQADKRGPEKFLYWSKDGEWAAAGARVRQIVFVVRAMYCLLARYQSPCLVYYYIRSTRQQ
jgi:hypothetical protein